MIVLGIETSCDDTCAAVVRDGFEIRSNVVSSQDEIHREYGGVVPEIASRHHDANIIGIYAESLSRAGLSLDDIDAVAVTRGPGLVGSLLVGLSVAKALAFGKGLPFVGVSHLGGHLYSVFLPGNGRSGEVFPLTERHIGLVASGGHTALFLVDSPTKYSLIGPTLDDAVGEAFDKVAKFLGLSYPGGPAIEAEAAKWRGDPIRFTKPSPRKDPYAFSFSGLKTAVINWVRKEESHGNEVSVPRIADSFQQTVAGTLAERTLAAALDYGVKKVTYSGGVSANSYIREYLRRILNEEGIELFCPPRAFCSDNAAMIAGLGYHYLKEGRCSDWSLNAEVGLKE
jgi:N6-L-threonylcarbamoyladenine synthase